MARSLTATEVLEAVKQLRDDGPMSALRRKIMRRHDLHEGIDDPAMPDHMTQTGAAYINSLRPAHLMQTLASFMASYPTTTTVYPESQDDQHKGDEAEKRLAVLRADLFPEKIRAEMRWHQGISGPGVYKLCCYDAGESPQWSIEVCDILSCYFPNPRNAPDRPRRIAREYTMLAGEILDKYGRNREKQPEHNDGRSKLTNNAGNWSFEPISRGVSTPDGGQSRPEPGAASSGDFSVVSVVEYDDGACTYIVVKNKTPDPKKNVPDGTKVWEYENLTNGTHYVVVPGHMTGSSIPEERILPYLNGVQNVISQINFVRAVRATRFTAARFQVAVERDPDLLKAAEQIGWAQAAIEAEAQYERDVMYFDGKPYYFALPPDEDMKALEESLEREYQEMASSEVDVTSAETVQQGTVRGQQLAVGQREKQKTLMLSYEDEAEKMILKMVLETIKHPRGYTPEDSQGWGYFAMQNVAYGKGEVPAGTRLFFNKETFDFPFEIAVTTASKTEEAKQLAFQAAVEAIGVGLGLTDEALEAKGVQDIAGWLEKKAEDDAYKEIASAMGPNFVLTTFQERMRLHAGIMVQVPGLMMPGDPMAQQNVDANGAPNAFPPPATNGAQGGSGPAGNTVQQPY